MEKEADVLIVSSRIENRRALLRTFEGLPLNVFTAWTIDQAKEMLPSHTLAVIFCEERVSDGSYRELLYEVLASQQLTRLVVVLCTGEWEGYLEALRLGAAEVLRSPLQAPDIDIALFHAMRERRQNLAVYAASQNRSASLY
jgi:DNA-binding NtrC family response regulator